MRARLCSAPAAQGLLDPRLGKHRGTAGTPAPSRAYPAPLHRTRRVSYPLREPLFRRNVMNIGPRGLAGTVLVAGALAACGSNLAPPGGQCTLPPATQLSVVKVDPPTDATGVFAGTNVSVSFNTCIDPASVKAPNFLLAAGASLIPGSLSYDAPSATVLFDPSANLAYSTLYLMAVSGVRGAHGEALAVPFGSSFTTQAAAEFVPPTTTASPQGGRYNATQYVTLTCADNPGGTGCAAIYYTADGSTPTAASPRYTGPIAIADNATLRFFSVDA